MSAAPDLRVIDRPDPAPSEFFADARLRVAALGAFVLADGHLKAAADGRLYRYHRGVYQPDGEVFVRTRVRELLEERYARRHVEEVMAWVKAREAEIGDEQPRNVLNVANGLLDWKAGELHPHDPAVISTAQIPVEWNPGAECPAVAKFLSDVMADDAIGFAYELMGLALYPGNPTRQALLLMGPGGNGKTLFLKLVKELVGSQNVASVSLQQLTENRFAVAELYGKLANICGDLDARAVTRSDTFKQLTGGDPVLAERKHRDPFTFTSYASMFFSANEAPFSADQTEAWFDRWLVVSMPKRIPAEKQDPHLLEKLTTKSEMEGLLVEAVTGLCRLMERGRFRIPDSVQEARDDYREHLDTVQAFVAESCRLDPEAWCPKSQLYSAYRDWARGSGRMAVSAQRFSARLVGHMGGALEECKTRGERRWRGIDLISGATDPKDGAWGA